MGKRQNSTMNMEFVSILAGEGEKCGELNLICADVTITAAIVVAVYGAGKVTLVEIIDAGRRADTIAPGINGRAAHKVTFSCPLSGKTTE
jgi:hypothetical protein